MDNEVALKVNPITIVKAIPDIKNIDNNITSDVFVETNNIFGGLDFPKAEQGILIPTGKSSEFSPLFRWVTL